MKLVLIPQRTLIVSLFAQGHNSRAHTNACTDKKGHIECVHSKKQNKGESWGKATSWTS